MNYGHLVDSALYLGKRYGPQVLDYYLKSKPLSLGRRPWRGSFKYSKKGYRRLRRKICAPEIHYLDVNWASAVIAANGQFLQVSNVAQGDNYYERTARIVVAKYIQIEFFISPPTTAGSTDQVQISVVADAQPNNATPTYGEIFDTSLNPVGQCFRNLCTNINRFRIIFSTVVALVNGAGGTPIIVKRFIKIPLKTSRVVFAGNAASVPESNAFFVLLASVNNTGLAATSAAARGSVRFAFHEC